MRPVIAVVLAIAIVAPALAGPAPDERPADPGEWGFRPAEGSRAEVDPPAFVWRPQKLARAYAIRVERAPESPTGGREVAYEASGIRLPTHCPPRTLGPGEYAWRFRADDGDWSGERTFSIAAGTPEFPLPARDELLARIPDGHPRILFREEDLPRLEELAKGRLRAEWDDVVRRCERLIANPVDVTEPSTYLRGEVRGVNDAAWRARWWGNRKRVLEVVDGAATLGFAWRVGGDRRFAAEGKRLLLAACSWNPTGATGYRYNDEAGMPFVWAGSRAYTWLHDVLDEEERAVVRAVMRVRGGEMSRHLIGGHHIWRPYSSHANRAWHWLGELGTAFHGEIEGADDDAWFAMNVFHAAYPVWSDADGGWHEGLAYWTSYVGRATQWLLTMKAIYRHDGFRKPFFSRAGDFALYVAPPGETMGGFGDLTLGFDSKRCSPVVGLLARMTGNAAWQWYVDGSGERANQGGYLGFLTAALPAVEGKAPTDLPSSTVFRGTGVAVLHRDLVNRETDVQLMLKSSPMGSQSHGYESQNAFLLSVAGEPIFIRSGRRDLYGSPHHRDWMWRTKSVNSLLVDGLGQVVRMGAPLGRISRFSTGRNLDYVVGEAARAYGDRLERFSRAVLFVKPDLIVMLDDVVAREPSTFQWLLHSPTRIRVEGSTLLAAGEAGAATVTMLHPAGLEISQTDRFEPPPQEWVKLRQWHLTASTRTRSRTAAFVTVIRPHRSDASPPPLVAVPIVTPILLGVTIDRPDGRISVAWRRDLAATPEPGPEGIGAEASVVLSDREGRTVRTIVPGR